MNLLNGPWSQGGQLLSWLAREHCTRHPDAVAKAWEAMAPHAPTLADCGRMYAAYGQSFTVPQLRYLSRHPEALSLARWSAAGWHYLEFDPRFGFIPKSNYVELQPGRGTYSLWSFCLGAIAMFCLAIVMLPAGKTELCTSAVAVGTVSLVFSLLEFVDVRSRHHARRAISLCLAPPAAGAKKCPTAPVGQGNGFRVREEIF